MRFRHLLFFIAEHGSTRALDALTTLALIRNLDKLSLGVFMAYQSQVAILMLAFPALENALYREHGKHKAENTLGHELAVYRKFNLAKLVIAAVLTALGAAVPIKGVLFSQRLAAFSLAFAFPLAQGLYGIFREPLRFELHQGVIVALNALQRLSVLGSILMVAHFLGKNDGPAAIGVGIEPIAIAAISIYFIFGMAWARTLRKLLSEVPWVTVSAATAWGRIRRSCGESVLWLHLCGTILTAVQMLDVYFLSRTSLGWGELAAYSVALKAANFFQIIPSALTQAWGVYLGRRSGCVVPQREQSLVWRVFLGYALLGAAMCGAGFYGAAPLIAFLSKNRFSTDELAQAQKCFKLILLGVAVSSACYAHSTYIGSRGNIGQLTRFVLLPWLGFAALAYGMAASHGMIAMAWMNIPVAAFYAAGQILYFSCAVRASRRGLATQAN